MEEFRVRSNESGGGGGIAKTMGKKAKMMPMAAPTIMGNTAAPIIKPEYQKDF
jgi:hypothetical protein